MVRIPRIGWLVAAVATVGIGFGTACKKDGGGVLGGSSASSDDLSLLPKDSDIVLGVDVAQLQKSLLWKKFVEPQMAKSDFQQNLTEFKTRCGFDPSTSVTSVTLGLKVGANNEPDGVIVVHGFDKTKSAACFDKWKPDMEKEGVTASVDNGVYLIKSKNEKTVAVTFVNDTTMVMVTGANATTAGAKAAATGTSALKSSPTFTELYSKVNAKDSVWGVANGNAPFFGQMGAMTGSKPKAVFGSVNVTDGLAIDLRMRLESPDQAKTLADMGKAQAGQVAAMVDKFDVTNDGPDVKINVALSNAKLESLVQQYGGMLGMGQ